MATQQPEETATDWELAGGETVLRPLIEDFVDRMFDDVMIGFLFDGRSRTRIAEMELRLVSEQMGGPYAYTGRDLGKAHRKHPIMGGHFARRRKILDDTAREHGLPDAVRERWLAHVDALRDRILGQDVDDRHCDHAEQAARLEPGASSTGEG